MDIYHIWCDLKPGVRDLDFVDSARAYLDELSERGLIRSYRITRAKLGFRPPALREFHLTLEFDDLAQLQTTFDWVSSRADPAESLHHAVNSKVQDAYFALYRDFPDEGRSRGEEKF